MMGHTFVASPFLMLVPGNEGAQLVPIPEDKLRMRRGLRGEQKCQHEVA